MLHDNKTPFAAIAFDQWHRDGPTMACVAVRGSFVLGEDGGVHLAEAQEIVLADEFDGDPQRGPLIRPNDLVPWKPGTDVTFLGALHAPPGEAYHLLEGALSVAGLTKVIRATGPRQWQAEGEGWRLSEPDPVSDVLLDWRLASGGRLIGDPEGTVDPRNPIGVNLIDPVFTPKGRNYPAAQIFSKASPITNDFRHPPEPQGLGPISPWWQSRQLFAGTYGEDWLAERHPRLPANFDYRFYQCAPPDQRFDGFLNGGERIDLTNLTLIPKLSLHLPDVALWARFDFTDGREVPVRLNLDGIHLDFRGAPWRFDLTWRGWIETCPALHRVDLHTGGVADVLAMDLPVSGEAGLRVAQMA